MTPPVELEGVSTFELVDSQDEWWRTADGVWLRVEDIEPRHRRNLIAWLEGRFVDLCHQTARSLMSGPQPMGEMACDSLDRAIDELFELTVAETPLYRRLVALEALEL